MKPASSRRWGSWGNYLIIVNKMGSLYDGFIYSLSSSSIDKEKHLHFILRTLGFENNYIKTNLIEALYKYNDTDSVYKILKGEMSFKKNFVDYNEFGINTLYSAPILKYLKPKTQISLNYVSATDISSFVYCPASYSIKQTFHEIPHYNEETEIGIELHEQNRLAIYAPEAQDKNKFTEIINTPEFYTEQNKHFFDDIRTSSIYYIGHSENPVRYFRSSKGKFVGQPDYIFKNRSGENFVVEEKFKYFKNRNAKAFSNHKAQLISYLTGLDTINAKYGYLVYWYYDYKNSYRYIRECIIYRIERTLSNQNYMRSIYNDILILNCGQSLFFDINQLDANKCANCVMRIFCGHKTGKFSEITVPYDKDYYELVK